MSLPIRTRVSTFFRETCRALRRRGDFLYADTQPDHAYPRLIPALKEAGFEIIEKAQINLEVLRAMELDNARRLMRVDHEVFRTFARLFARSTGSCSYRKLQSGHSRYFRIVAREPAATAVI